MIIYWWQRGTLFNAQATDDEGRDPSEVYVSTDLSDVLQQVGYNMRRDVIRGNDTPWINED